MPRSVNHVGYLTFDMERTYDFYCGILQMSLVGTVIEPAVLGTGEEFPFLHAFFGMADGSSLAFFEVAGLARPQAPSSRAHSIFNHIALNVSSRAELDAWRERLEHEGVPIEALKEHQITSSLYFYDPSGYRVELAWTSGVAALGRPSS